MLVNGTTINGKGDNIYSKSGLQTLKNAEGEEIDREWKNYCVVDDSSKFATAVYYHYINKEILKDKPKEERTAYDIDLWGTSSEDFINIGSFINKLMMTNKFDLIKWTTLKKNKIENKIELYRNDKKFELKIGDAICRKGHVEFYVGGNKVISWGRVHKTYTINKAFEVKIDGYHSNDSEDEDKPFISILRFKGGNNQ